jgi:CheY-like chemotaxis protein
MAILIADDDMTMCLILRRWVERAGLTCDIAKNGVEAVAATKAKSYDVVFMDVYMPVMNGCEACLDIQRESKESRLPYVVGIVSIDDITTSQQCRDSGMKEVLCKPLNQQTFRDVIFRAGIDAKGAYAGVGIAKAPDFNSNYGLACVCPITAGNIVEPGSRQASILSPNLARTTGSAANDTLLRSVFSHGHAGSLRGTYPGPK